MIFILNKQEKVVNILRNGGGANQAPPFFDDVYSQDLATGAETFSFSTIAINNVASDLVVGNYVAFKNDDGEYKLFQITQTEEYHEDAMYINVYAEGAGLELINKVFRARKSPSTTLRKFMEMVLDETGWNVGMIPFSIQESLDLDLPDATVYSTLQSTLSKYGVEMAFRCEINHGRISSKFVDLYTQRGRVTGKRFSFGRDIEGIKRKVDSSELFTALIGRGNKDISFKDVTVDGIDKPLGQDFVADQESYDRYNNNGYHIVGIFKYDTDSPEELLRETYKQLEKCKEPKIEYEVSVVLLGELLGNSWEKVRIGDTVAIVDNAFNPPIHLMARVSKMDKSFTNNQSDTCTLANFVEVQSNITDEMRKIASELEGYVEGAIESKFPIGGEDIKDGAINGSHIYQNTISTDHLVADAVTADKIKANQITTKHLQADSIKSEHIDAEQIEAEHIKSGTITADKITSDEFITNSAQIKDGIIGTAQIGDAQITVAKIQDLFVDDLVANQGKFQSAHIGKLTSDNIDANTIKAEHITASVIDAINLNVEGKISADRIDVSSLTVEEIDAGKITTGDLNADRIKASVISAVNLSTEEATINSAKIGNLTADKISGSVIEAINLSVSGKISADKIDVDSIKVNNIDAGKITSGFLSADRIKAGTITAEKINSETISTIELGASSIVADKITSGEIKVTDANIVDGTISGAKISKATISNAQISTAFVADAYIKNLDAGKITSGTLDANKVTVKNLKADNIIAGSITVQGENLLHNSAMKKPLILFQNGVNESNNLDNWINTYTQNIIVSGTMEHYKGYNYLKLSGASGTTSGVVLSRLPFIQGEQYVFSFYYRIEQNETISNTFGIILDGFTTEENAIKGVIGKSVAIKTWADSTVTKGSWTKIVMNMQLPTDSAWSSFKYFALRPRFLQNDTGVIRIAMPMLSKGTIASVFKEHNDELISNGAIDNDKIGDSAITSNKLNIDELFVGENAFIKSLKAVEIDASNITTGKISGERIDISGLVSFEALDETLNGVFKPVYNSNGVVEKTYINGGMISTGTVSADKINLYSGLSVQKNGITTFAISQDGSVQMDGLLQSSNFDLERNLGYQISPEGTAIFNQAKIKGDIELPNAGITNYGGGKGDNFLRNSNFSEVANIGTSITWDKELNGTKMPSYWSGFNSGVPEATKGYHAHLDNSTFSFNTMVFVNLNSKYNQPKRWMGASHGIPLDIHKFKPNTKYTFSMDIYCDTKGIILHGGLYHKLTTSTSASFNSGSYYFTSEENEVNRWVRKTWTFTTNSAMKTDEASSWYVYGYTGVEGTAWIKNLKLEEGDIANDWSVESSLLGKNVRFWAGSTYQNRDVAPFRVQQDGSLFANNGTFSGTMYGQIENENLHISNGTLTISNETKTLMDDGSVLSFQPRALSENVKLSSNECIFDTDMKVGGGKIAYSKGSNRLNIKGTELSVEGNQADVTFNTESGAYGGLNIIGCSQGHHILRGSTASDKLGTLVFDSEGNQGQRGDFSFTRKNYEQKCKVDIDGDLSINEKITSQIQKIEMRSVKNSTWEGWGFYAT